MSLKKPDYPVVTHRWPDAAEPVYLACAKALDTEVRLGLTTSPSLLVGYSGGLDSHLLLRAAHRWCCGHGVDISAAYVDHGLQACSADWAAHCRRECDRLSIRYQVLPAQVSIANADSPEQAARDARYRVLAGQIEAAGVLLTAHHADDQAETLLLQLLRGAGVRGLASMPQSKVFGAGLQVRPLLSVTREQLEQAARALNLSWVEDTTNRDTRYDRNYLRHEVLPRLTTRWPAAVASLSRSASHCADAASLLRNLADEDLSVAAPVLSVSALLVLTGLRRRNVLRGWIEHHGFVPPSTIKMHHIEQDLVLAAAQSSGRVNFGGAQICRHRDKLYLGEPTQFEPCDAFSYEWSDRGLPLLISETGQQLTAAELPPFLVSGRMPLAVKSRQGGEKIRLAGKAHSQSVKSLLQQMGRPAWERSRLPFIWCNNQLVGIVGIGFCQPPG